MTSVLVLCKLILGRSLIYIEHARTVIIGMTVSCDSVDRWLAFRPASYTHVYPSRLDWTGARSDSDSSVLLQTALAILQSVSVPYCICLTVDPVITSFSVNLAL